MAIGTARQTQFQQTHYLRKLVNYNDTGIAAGVLLGTLPAGAQILRTTANVTTAFNAATTNVLNVGTTATGAQVAATATLLPGAAGFKTDLTGSALNPATAFASDTDVFVSYTQTGTAASAGSAIITIEYAPNNDK